MAQGLTEMTATTFKPERNKSTDKREKIGKNITQNYVPYFFSYPQTAKLLVTAYPSDSKPELESLHFIQVVTVWHTQQPQNIEVAASKVGRKIVSLCVTTQKKKKRTCQYKLYKTSNCKCGK